jgi:O-antigen ligase
VIVLDASEERRIVAAAAVGVCAAVFVSLSPELVAAAIGVAALPFLLRSALVRAGFLVIGGFVTLQSGVDRITADKVVYASGVTLAAVIAMSLLLRRRGESGFEPLSTLWPLPVGVGTICLLSAPVAWTHDVAASDWLRDAGTYALLALVPLFVSDLTAEVFDRRMIAALFGPLAAASTLSFTLEWLYRRRILDFDASIGLPSFFFPAALFAFAMSAALLGQERQVRLVSLAVAVAVFGLLMSTGTRSTVVLLAAVLPPWIHLITRQGRPSARALLVPVAALAVAVGLVTALVTLTDGRVSARLRDIPETIVDPTSDQSYQLRADAWRAAWNEFEDHPVLGVGAGFRFTWSLPRGGTSVRNAYNVDSPFGFPAKFGVIGLLLLGLSIVALARFMVATRTRAAMLPWYAVLGFGSIALVSVPFGVPMEDKGLAFGLLGLLAMVAVSVRTTSLRPAESWAGRSSSGHPRGIADLGHL